jgi:hypothetical protein
MQHHGQEDRDQIFPQANGAWLRNESARCNELRRGGGETRYFDQRYCKGPGRARNQRGDLIGRDEADREARRDWWLSLLSEGEALNSEFLASVRSRERSARDVMVAPVVTVGQDTEINEIARLLTANRIKRVPVLRGGRIVGIVSRADLVRALAEIKIQPTVNGGGIGAGGGVEQRLVHPQERADRVRLAGPPLEPDETAPMAADFRQLTEDHERQEALHREEHRRAAAKQRRLKVMQLIDQHISDENWHTLMHWARQAAERGEKEFLLLRFPSQLCGDAGPGGQCGLAQLVGNIAW